MFYWPSPFQLAPNVAFSDAMHLNHLKGLLCQMWVFSRSVWPFHFKYYFVSSDAIHLHHCKWCSLKWFDDKVLVAKLLKRKFSLGTWSLWSWVKSQTWSWKGWHSHIFSNLWFLHRHRNSAAVPQGREYSRYTQVHGGGWRERNWETEWTLHSSTLIKTDICILAHVYMSTSMMSQVPLLPTLRAQQKQQRCLYITSPPGQRD
jgi:hypothetical protein